MFRGSPIEVEEPWCCFDRKTYTICEGVFLNQQDPSLPYERYLPLFVYDEEKIEIEYLKTCSNAWLLKEYTINNRALDERLIGTDGKESYRRFRIKTLAKLAIEWCKENHIKYEDDFNW